MNLNVIGLGEGYLQPFKMYENQQDHDYNNKIS